mgnify:FL=1
MVHRLLDRYFEGPFGGRNKVGLEDVPDVDELKEMGRRLSYTARRAEGAENELRTVKVLQLLTEHVGEEFEGVVTGVTNFGLFVQHPKYLIDGLLRMEDLGDDWWEVDVKAGRVWGERTRQTFTMGTLLKVQIAEVDVSARQLNLSLVQGGQPVRRRGGGREAEDNGRRPGQRGKRGGEKGRGRGLSPRRAGKHGGRGRGRR